MRLVIAIPALGLIAGAAVGVRWTDVPLAAPIGVMLGWVALSVHGLRVGRVVLLAAGVSGAFAAGGCALAVDAWHRAWKPSLRVAFDRASGFGEGTAAGPDDGEERAEAVAAARPDQADAIADADSQGGVSALVEGTLREDASPTASGSVSLSLRVEHAQFDSHAGPFSGGVLLTVAGELAPGLMSEWRAGRRIRAPALLRRAPRYLNPGVPDQERALARRGTILVGSIKSGALVDVMARGSRAAEWAAAARAYARDAVESAVGRWSPRSAAIVRAILIGDRTGLEPDVERRLQEAGTYHVIAISGGNIAILAALALGVFRMAGLLGRTAMISAASGLAVYGYVVVGGASVTRATLMAIVYFAGRACDLAGPPLHSLLLVAGLMVLIDPLAVVDVASLLSFGATLAIILVATGAWFSRVPTLLVPALGLAAASMAAEAALFPVSASVFQRITIAGLALNFAAIPLMAVAQLAGMAVVPLHALLPGVARLCGYVAHFGAEGLVRTADLVSLAPWSTWRVASPPAWAIVIYYGSCIVAMALRSSRPASSDTALREPGFPAAGFHAAVFRVPVIRAATLRVTTLRVTMLRVAICSAAGSAACVLGLGAAVTSRPADGQLHVTFIDVGQGDSAFVRFPAGSTMLIDAGGLTGTSAFDMGDRVVGPTLRHLGVRRLDAVVLTHGDADHMGGMLAMLRDFRPWDVWDGVPVPPHEPLERLRAEASAAHARWTTVQATDRVSIDGVDLVVRHPGLPDWERQKVRNDDSIVVELSWRGVSMVFTGDIGRDVERDLARQFAPTPLRVLKVPHHGSASSSSDAFVRALAPTVAVFSVGRGNRFGHPSPAVVDRYERSGAAIFRTDRDGAVSIDTDGQSLRVQTFTATHAACWPSQEGRRIQC